MESSPSAPKRGSRTRYVPGWPHSISSRIALAFCSLFFLVWLGIQWIELFGLPGGWIVGWADHLQQEELQRISSAADAKKRHLEDWIKERRDDLSIFVKSQQVQDAFGIGGRRAGVAAVQALIDEMVNTYGVYASFHLADARTGRVLATTTGAYDSRLAPELLAEVAAPGQDETLLVRQGSDGGAKLMIARQVGEHDRPAGIAVLAIDLESEVRSQLENQLEESLGRTGETVLYDPDGHFLNNPRYEFDEAAGSAGGRVDTSRVARLAVRGGEGSLIDTDYRNVRVLAAYRYIRLSPDVGWGMVVKKDEAEALQTLQAHLRSFAILSLVGLVFVFVSALLVARWIARPIRRVVEASRRIQAGELSARAEILGHGEAADLAITFNTLAGKFEEWHAELDSQVREQTEVIRSQEGRLLAFSESTSDAIVAIDAHADINFWNPAAERMFGYSSNEVMGRNVHRLLTPKEQLAAADRAHGAFIANGEGMVLGRIREVEAITKHGDRLIVELTISPLKVGDEWHAIGTLRDITLRKREESILRTIAEQLSVKVGEDYFRTLCLTLGKLVGADYVLVGELVPGDAPAIRTIGLAGPHGLMENFDYPVAGTPAEALERGDICLVPVDARDIYPEDALLRRLGVQSFAGIALRDIELRTVGLLAVMWTSSRANTGDVETYLRFFAGPAATEMERTRARRQLDRYAQKLEDMVSERTQELVSAIATLKRAQHDLVESEKLASLGRMVAGIAHELNTPIGNSVTVASTLGDRVSEFLAAVESNTVRKSMLREFCAGMEQGARLLQSSLQLAARLIHDFKQVAVDQTSSQRRVFDLKTVVEEIVATMHPQFKKTSHRIDIAMADGIELDSYPGPLGQVLTNLIQNALVHGFESREGGILTIEAQVRDERGTGVVDISVSDNGCGMPPEVREKIFDPFFTTKLGRGGSGLGMNIVYNIVVGVLGGRIAVTSDAGKGATFRIAVPVKAP